MAAPDTRWHVDTSVNLGTLIMAAVAVVGLITYFVDGRNAGVTNSATTARLEASLRAQASDTKEQINNGLSRVEVAITELKEQIRSIPDISARLAQFERDVRRGEERDAVQDNRLDALRDRVVGLAADVEGLKRASSVALPGSGARPR